LRAFEHGASGVLVVGCPMNACHYGFGNKRADEHFGTVQNMLHLLGYSPERFQWAWPAQDQDSSFGELINWFVRSIAKEAVCELPLENITLN
jgi:coenzyme F420-reducing hydrogenase delta subunit